MTTEEKAKAYDEALKKIQPLYEQAKKDDNPTWSTYEYLFPKLRESEDERIRKSLIEYFKRFRPTDMWDSQSSFEQVVAYLEKQKDANKAIEAVERIDKYIKYMLEFVANTHEKESNPDIKKYYCGMDDTLSSIAGILQDVYSNEKQEEQKPAENSVYPHSLDEAIQLYYHTYGNGKGGFDYLSLPKFQDIVEEFVKDYGQKPAEWSYPYGRNETVDKLMAIAECLETDGDCTFNGHTGKVCGKFLRELARKQIESHPAEWSEDDKKMLDNAIHACLDVYGTMSETANWLKTHLKSLRPQSEQEWSEEDERLLNLIIYILDREEHNGIITHNELIMCVRLLKSLRPQPKYKRSEEDKEILSEKEKEFYRQNGRLDVLYAPEKYGLQSIEETEKETHSIYGWVARDAFKNALTLFLGRKPYRAGFDSLGIWHTTGNFITLSSDLWEGNPNDLFPNLKWEDEPLPVKINIVEDKHDN